MRSVCGYCGSGLGSGPLFVEAAAALGRAMAEAGIALVYGGGNIGLMGTIARAVLEATAYQTKEVVDAMCADSGVPIGQLRADGGMTDNDLLMQFQADLLGIPVVRPADNGTTVLGAAYAAGFAVGYWPSLTAPRDGEPTTWHPAMPSAEAERLFADWNRAVERSYAWQPTAGG